MPRTRGDKYYIPHGSKWPIVGSVALFITMLGVASLAERRARRPVGLLRRPRAAWLFMFFGWFGTVIGESQAGIYNAGVDRSFRMGMMWFIFSEVMFFAAFFGALFYARNLSVPWLGGEGSKFLTNLFLWNGLRGGLADQRPGGRRRRVRDDPGVRPAGDQHRDPADVAA